MVVGCVQNLLKKASLSRFSWVPGSLARKHFLMLTGSSAQTLY